MRLAPLAAALLAAASASAADFDDAGVVLTYKPEMLWRSASGAYLAGREGEKTVLVYDFFGEGDGYSPCPTHGGGVKPAATCEESQRAVGDAFQLWAGAAGNLVVRRRSGGERVNFWISWTSRLQGAVVAPRGRSVDNSRDARAGDPETDADAAGFAKPMHPGSRKEFGALFFNDQYCWVVDDESACPAPTNPSGLKSISIARPLRATSLHEGGHVLGFGHFTASSIMGVAGGSGRYELTPLDRAAIRLLYEKAGR
jgi:hypothetical protein